MKSHCIVQFRSVQTKQNSKSKRENPRQEAKQQQMQKRIEERTREEERMALSLEEPIVRSSGALGIELRR